MIPRASAIRRSITLQAKCRTLEKKKDQPCERNFGRNTANSGLPTSPMTNLAANVCLLSPPSFDAQSFSLWVSGFSPSLAGKQRCKIDLGDRYGNDPEHLSILRLYCEETLDCFRTYQMLVKSFEIPRKLHGNAFMAPFTQKQRAELVSKYYGFESTVMRAFLGRKLTNKFRKDLGDVVETCGIPLRSVRRQFDNLRRLFDRIDDVGDNVKLLLQEFLELDFMLPGHLSRSYACAVFLLTHRFQLEISKKKYQLLTWEDCSYVAEQIMRLLLKSPVLRDGNVLPPTNESFLDDKTYHLHVFNDKPSVNNRRGVLDLDGQLLADLRDIKSIFNARCVVDEYVELIKNKTDSKVKALRLLVKNLFRIAVGLSQAKEFRDFFEDVLDDICVPLKGLQPEDIDHLFQCVVVCLPQVSQVKVLDRPAFLKSWERYVTLMSSAAIRLVK
jgi:hypothetical protein